MAEYIEREASLEAAKKSHLYFDIKPIINSIPAADVRPVVLCRDCKWAETVETDDPAIYCMQWDRWETPPDGFCRLGEKREES